MICSKAIHPNFESDLLLLDKDTEFPINCHCNCNCINANLPILFHKLLKLPQAAKAELFGIYKHTYAF